MALFCLPAAAVLLACQLLIPYFDTPPRAHTENILFASSGRWAGRAVAIDAVVQRRPPGGLMSVEDSACERLAELALNDADVAGALLRQALQPCGDAVAAVPAASMREAAVAFQQGLKAALEAVASIKGLLEVRWRGEGRQRRGQGSGKREDDSRDSPSPTATSLLLLSPLLLSPKSR